VSAGRQTVGYNEDVCLSGCRHLDAEIEKDMEGENKYKTGEHPSEQLPLRK
jgi:hypothetical protein